MNINPKWAQAVIVMAFFVAYALGACGSDDDSGSANAAGQGGGGANAAGQGGGALPGANRPVENLETECALSCNNQVGCPNDFPPAQCTDSCIGMGEMFPECMDAWIALNHCMADDTLFCDAQGYSATSNCVELADDYGACLGP